MNTCAWAAVALLPWLARPALGQPAEGEGGADRLGTLHSVTEPSLGAVRPRFSPDGARLVFAAGESGARDLWMIGVDGQGLERLTETDTDERDPTFTPDGARVVFSSDREGSYDVYAMPVGGGSAERLTDLDGDELEPAVSPLEYAFYAVGPGICGSAAESIRVDGYRKVAFTRRIDGRDEIWFTGMGAAIPVAHQGRLSPEGRRCSEPAWSGGGLSLAFTCRDEAGPVIEHAQAAYDQTLAEAVAALDMGSDWESGTYCTEGDIEGELPAEWSTNPCFSALPRRYAGYPGQARSAAGDGLSAPTYSTNQILLLATPDGGGDVATRPVDGGGAWARTGLPAGVSAEQAVWSPDGQHIAFVSAVEGGRVLVVVETDFYLQEVVDLVDYPELYGAGRSERLDANRFVARPGAEREFFRLYDQLNYRRRAPFVTADAALQAFHDEFARLLRQGEQDAQVALGELSTDLFEIYADRFEASGSESDRYLAKVFGVAAALLEAADRIEPGDDLALDWWMVADCQRVREDWEAVSEDDRRIYEQECAPYMGDERSVVEQMAAVLPAVVAELPESMRAEVQRHLSLIQAHGAIEDVVVPGRGAVPIDYTQFQVRGHYAESEQAGYFLAMMWYGLVPLPLDAGAFDLLGVLESTRAPASGWVGGQPTLMERWGFVDRLVGAFMGRPVDVSLAHLARIRDEAPELLDPARAADLRERLLELRGPVPFRGLAGALEGGQYPLQLTLFPRRYGRDVEFFTRLTHPDVELRGMPSALDVFAAVGIDQAGRHALAQAAGESYHEAYREALGRLVEENSALPEGYWSTDLYHGWLAMLMALAESYDVPLEGRLDFTRTEAWRDRLLSSTLAGYAQLKHDAVLYAFQESGVECGDEASYWAFVEQPLLPAPRGFVDPQPTLFRAMAHLAGRVYSDLAGGEPPDARGWAWAADEDDPALNAQTLAVRLADIAEAEVRGEALTDDDAGWLLQVGPLLEALFLSEEPTDDAHFGNDEGRMERGVALATDIYTNPMRGQVVQIAIGRILDLYVAVPNAVGQRMTQGGLFSFYEFTQPMSDRLTDEAWNARIESGEMPALPTWTRSFVEPQPSQ